MVRHPVMACEHEQGCKLHEDVAWGCISSFLTDPPELADKASWASAVPRVPLSMYVHVKSCMCESKCVAQAAVQHAMPWFSHLIIHHYYTLLCTCFYIQSLHNCPCLQVSLHGARVPKVPTMLDINCLAIAGKFFSMFDQGVGLCCT